MSKFSPLWDLFCSSLLLRHIWLGIGVKKNVTDFLFLDGLCRDVPFGDMHPMEAGMKVNFIFYSSVVNPEPEPNPKGSEPLSRIQIRSRKIRIQFVYSKTLILMFLPHNLSIIICLLTLCLIE